MVDADSRTALVRVARVNCAECGGCGLLARNREHTMEFTAENRLGVKGGDEVILEVPSRRLSLAYLVAFGLPVLAMVAGYFLGEAVFGLFMEGGAQGPAILAAVVVGLVSFWGYLKLAEHRGFSPAIIRVVDSREAGRIDAETGEGRSGIGGFQGKVL
ncbi:MAG: SoxR reducing system RseC family protein [Actinomycetota bacterium]